MRVAGADTLDAAGGGGELDPLRDVLRAGGLALHLREHAAARLAPEGALVIDSPAGRGEGRAAQVRFGVMGLYGFDVEDSPEDAAVFCDAERVHSAACDLKNA